MIHPSPMVQTAIDLVGQIAAAMQDPLVTFPAFFNKTICSGPVRLLQGEVSAFGRLMDFPDAPTAQELTERIRASEYSPATWRKITKLHSDADANPRGLSILTRMEHLRKVNVSFTLSFVAHGALQATRAVQKPSQVEAWVGTVLTSMISITEEKLWRPHSNHKLTCAQLEKQFFEHEYAKDIEIWRQQEGGGDLEKRALRQFRRNEKEIRHEQLLLAQYFNTASLSSLYRSLGPLLTTSPM